MLIPLAELAKLPMWEYDPKAKGWRYTGAEKDRRANQWVYLPETRVLLHPPMDYEVDLERCGDWTEIAHWVFHVGAKAWACENNVLADLVSSLRAIFGPRHPRGREDGCMIDLDAFDSQLQKATRQ